MTEYERISKVLMGMVEILHDLRKEVQLLKTELKINRAPDPHLLPSGYRHYYTIKDTCKIFGISKSTFSRWRKEGKIRVVGEGVRMIRVEGGEIERLINQSSKHYSYSWFN